MACLTGFTTLLPSKCISAFCPLPQHSRINLTLPLNCNRSTSFRPHSSNPERDKQEESHVEDLTLPEDWTTASAAAQEAEWLRINLHKWLDNEYCPEAANVEISKRCASVYYLCLVEKELDPGNILMRMVDNLQTFSFKESFHGAFSSANAAIDLILNRVNQSQLS